MKSRWIIAATAAIGAGVLAASMMMGASKRVEVLAPAENSTASRTPACKADKKANLEFTLKDMHGAKVHLADFKGKVILVNFWATWCPPCKAELPGLIALHQQYKDKGLVILGISEDDEPETLRNFA